MSAKVTEQHRQTAQKLFLSVDGARFRSPASEDIAQALADAEQAEREACAGLCSEHAEFCHREVHHGGHASLRERANGATHLASKIRARGTPAKEKADG